MAAKKKAIRREDMLQLEEVLNPDFSEHVKDGIFNAVDAFECHINCSLPFLSGAKALLEGVPEASQALSLLELYEVAMTRGIEEAYRAMVIDPEKAA